MDLVVSYRGNNIFEVELTEPYLWFWRRRIMRQAYWDDMEGFCWVDTEERIDDPDVRVALFETHFKESKS